MDKKALVVIDIQNDITKHYRDIINNINSAIDWSVKPDVILLNGPSSAGKSSIANALR